MAITLFGVIWVIILIAFFKNTKNILFLILLAMSLQCVDCIRVAGIGIGPHIITCCFYLAITFHTKIKKSKDKLFIISGVVLFLTIIISLSINNVLNISTLFKAIQFLTYLLTANSFVKNTRLEILEIKEVINKLMVFLLLMGLIQLLMTMNLLPRIWLVNELLYNNVNNVAFYNNHYFRICSTFMEPSYYAPFLCSMFFYYYNETGKKERTIILAIIVEIILTFSSTAYAALIISFILYMLIDMFYTKTLKKKNIAFIVVGLICFVLLLVSTDVLEKVIFNKSTSVSAIVRNQWNERALESFYSSPLFGVGYKQSRASSIINCLLGELGIIGLSSYLLMILGLIKIIAEKQNTLLYIIMILTVLICQIVAIPDIDLSSAWLVIFICCLLISSNTKQIEKNIGGYIEK